MPKPRKGGNRRPKTTLRIFCEGEKTEPYYINGYLQDHFPSSRAGVVQIQSTKKNTPVQLVDEAIKLKQSDRSLPEDEFWVVYDRESVAKYSKSKHAEAWEKASSANVKVALSNVCFELWLLLHVANSTAAYSCCEDLLEKSPLKAELKKRYGLIYEKSSQDIYRHLSSLIPEARRRAVALNANSAATNRELRLPFDLNPFTAICDLLDAIDNFK
jgi:hypothetical protein